MDQCPKRKKELTCLVLRFVITKCTYFHFFFSLIFFGFNLHGFTIGITKTFFYCCQRFLPDSMRLWNVPLFMIIYFDFISSYSYLLQQIFPWICCNATENWLMLKITMVTQPQICWLKSPLHSPVELSLHFGKNGFTHVCTSCH